MATVYDVFCFLREHAGHQVAWREIRAAFPDYDPNKLRNRANKLVAQGYVEKDKEADTYQFKEVAA